MSTDRYALDVAPGVALDPKRVRDISPDVLDEYGRLRIMPASYWRSTMRDERILFGTRRGIYNFPTEELVKYLRHIIGGRSAIEIGAGNGVLASALGITATDSYQQRRPKYRMIYERAGQPIVPYGSNVIEINAYQALRKFKPQVVIGCWVTHLYDPVRHEAGGNEVGVDEVDVLDRCETYVHVGNEKVHEGKAIWSEPHTIAYPEWVYSRAHNGTRDFVAQWDRRM